MIFSLRFINCSILNLKLIKLLTSFRCPSHWSKISRIFPAVCKTLRVFLAISAVSVITTRIARSKIRGLVSFRKRVFAGFGEIHRERRKYPEVKYRSDPLIIDAEGC